MRIYLLLPFLCFTAIVSAQNSVNTKKKEVLNTQSILLIKTNNLKTDSTQFKTPKYKQGFFCNFEDQLNRKKVPIDFSLGKSKY
jgi:hypothetical protein